jgi:hypothetical protein
MKGRRLRAAVSSVVLGAAMLLMAAPSSAQPAPPAKPWYESIGLGFFLQSTYTHNFGHPDSSTNQFRVFDTEAGSVRLDVAEVVIQKKVAARGEAGFRVVVIVCCRGPIWAAA